MKGLAEGQYIKHAQYGLGVITETDSDTDRTTIDFNDHGTKTFVTSIMVVEPAEGTPPARPKRRKKARSTTTTKAKKTEHPA